MSSHPEQWKKIKAAVDNQRLTQAMLFVGPMHCALPEFARSLTQLIFCKQRVNEPCLQCLDCKMSGNDEHPDMQWIKPEKTGGSIKIDQIRELQASAYLTPQRSNHRIIIIDAAERMNTASANALLKILEEPAPHTIFILIAQQLSTVLPTVLSRCQIIPFSIADESYSNNLLLLADKYASESDRALIIKNAESILDGLIALLEHKEHPCVLAAVWLQYELNTFLWFLYLVFAQLQHMHFKQLLATGPAQNQLIKLLSILNPILIFKQIDKINTLLGKLSHNMNVNHTLVLEDLLLSLVPQS